MEENTRATEAAPIQRKDNDSQQDTQEKAYISSESLAEKVFAVKQSIENAFPEKKVCGWNDILPIEVDSTATYPLPQPLIKSGNTGAFHAGNLSAISAKWKNGKSFLVTIFSSVILGSKFANMEAAKDGARVLFFDTEQDISDVAVMKKRVAYLRGLSPNVNPCDFKAIPMQQMDFDARLPLMEELVERLRPDAVFIDNVADLVRNFNDNVEGEKVIKTLKALAGKTRCSIILIIHENPTGEAKMRGHIGSTIGKEMDSQFSIKVENGVFHVEQQRSRHGEIEPFSFTLDEHLTPISAQEMVERKVADYRQEMRDKFAKCFGEVQEMKQSDLIRAIYPIFGISEGSNQTALKRIKEAVSCNILNVREQGKNKFYAVKGDVV